MFYGYFAEMFMIIVAGVSSLSLSITVSAKHELELVCHMNYMTVVHQ